MEIVGVGYRAKPRVRRAASEPRLQPLRRRQGARRITSSAAQTQVIVSGIARKWSPGGRQHPQHPQARPYRQGCPLRGRASSAQAGKAERSNGASQTRRASSSHRRIAGTVASRRRSTAPRSDRAWVVRSTSTLSVQVTTTCGTTLAGTTQEADLRSCGTGSSVGGRDSRRSTDRRARAKAAASSRSCSTRWVRLPRPCPAVWRPPPVKQDWSSDGIPHEQPRRP